ncbi:MAG: biopolymer transporter ExbD [Bacteroidales bacterium]|nr:biopolymer transporter ExbD [Bacteroidales bacterium]
MGKIKVSKNPPRIDMTPMVDLFFLLLVFFILTATFRTPEAVQVDTPYSVSNKTSPEKHLITITVSKDNVVFFNVDNGIDTSEHLRRKILNAMAYQYQLKFTPEEYKKFEGMSSFGMPIAKMKDWINEKDAEVRDAMHNGIPLDSTDNQLLYWIRFARNYNPDFEVALKGDQGADYEKVKKVIDVLQDNKVNKFNLTTNLEDVDVSLENL